MTSLLTVTFFSNITALIGIAIMLNVVCMSLARERKFTSPPKSLKRIFSGCLGKLLCLGNYSHQVLKKLVKMQHTYSHYVFLGFSNASAASLGVDRHGRERAAGRRPEQRGPGWRACEPQRRVLHDHERLALGGGRSREAVLQHLCPQLRNHHKCLRLVTEPFHTLWHFQNTSY